MYRCNIYANFKAVFVEFGAVGQPNIKDLDIAIVFTKTHGPFLCFNPCAYAYLCRVDLSLDSLVSVWVFWYLFYDIFVPDKVILFQK